MPKLPAILPLVVLLGLPMALSGCGMFDKQEQFAPVCPKLALLKDGADLTRFSPRGHDVTDLMLDGRLVRCQRRASRARAGMWRPRCG